MHESLDNMLLDIYKALRCYPEQARTLLPPFVCMWRKGGSCSLGEAYAARHAGSLMRCSLSAQLSVSHRSAPLVTDTAAGRVLRVGRLEGSHDPSRVRCGPSLR